jgi:transposase-like protein
MEKHWRLRENAGSTPAQNRGSLQSDEALLKLFCLALRNISKKWTMPIHDWKAALNRFTI